MDAQSRLERVWITDFGLQVTVHFFCHYYLQNVSYRVWIFTLKFRFSIFCRTFWPNKILYSCLFIINSLIQLYYVHKLSNFPQSFEFNYYKFRILPLNFTNFNWHPYLLGSHFELLSHKTFQKQFLPFDLSTPLLESHQLWSTSSTTWMQWKSMELESWLKSWLDQGIEQWRKYRCLASQEGWFLPWLLQRSRLLYMVWWIHKVPLSLWQLRIYQSEVVKR